MIIFIYLWLGWCDIGVNAFGITICEVGLGRKPIIYRRIQIIVIACGGLISRACGTGGGLYRIVSLRRRFLKRRLSGGGISLHSIREA